MRSGVPKMGNDPDTAEEQLAVEVASRPKAFPFHLEFGRVLAVEDLCNHPSHPSPVLFPSCKAETPRL